MRSLQILLRFFLLSCIAFLLWGGYSMYQKGLSGYWRVVIEEELAQKGLKVKIKKLSLGPLQGLRAKEIRFFHPRAPQEEMMQVDEIQLELDYPHLLKKKIRLKSLKLKHATLSLPLKSREALLFKKVNAHVLFSREKIKLTKLTGMFHALFFNLSGTIVSSSNLGEREADLGLSLLEQYEESIEKFFHALSHIAIESPKLEAHFFWNPEQEKSLKADFSLTSKSLQCEALSANKLQVKGGFDTQEIKITEVEITAPSGSFFAEAHFLFSKRLLSFRASSEIHLQQILTLLSDLPVLNEIQHTEDSFLSLEGSLRFPSLEEKDAGEKPLAQYKGHLKCGTFKVQKEPFLGLESRFSIKGKRFYITDTILKHKTGDMRLEALFTPEKGFRHQIDITMDFTQLLPFTLTNRTREFISRWKLSDMPKVNLSLTARGNTEDPNTWISQGKLFLKDSCRYNGESLQAVECIIEQNTPEGWWELKNLNIKRADGEVQIDKLRHYFRKKITSIEGGKSSVNLVAGTGFFSKKIALALQKYDFNSPPNLSFSGKVDAEKEQTDLHINLESRGVARVKFLGASLPFADVFGKIHLYKNRISLQGMRGQLFGGRAHLNTDIFSREDKKLYYEGKASIRETSFKKLSLLYSDYGKTKGKLSGTCSFNGITREKASLKATGTATLRNGNIFAIPLLGPLSGVIKLIIPFDNLTYSVAREAGMHFQIKGGVFQTKNFSALTPIFKLSGEGSIDFIKDDVDITMNINTRGATGLLFYPISKLLEYKAEGNLKNPQWRAKNFSASPNAPTGKKPPFKKRDTPFR